LFQRPKYCVDWDGVCAEERRPTGDIWWPDVGPWLPGAVWGLRALADDGLTVICSTRFNVLEYDHKAPRPPKDVDRDLNAIRIRLDEVGLEDVELYQPQWGKPPADYYIDDKAVFHTDWSSTLLRIGVREIDIP
jgi:hypothetical protein